jgi:lysophospholipase L1-like esterase
MRSPIGVAVCLVALIAPCADARAGKAHWVTAWECAPHGSQGAYPFPPPELTGTPSFPDGFSEQTLRLIVTPHAAGRKARVVLSNAFGTGSVTISAATIARRASGERVKPKSLAGLRFGERRSVTIPAGAQVISDPAAIRVAPFEDLAVSLAFAAPSGPPTYHYFGLQTSYLSPVGTGNLTRSAHGAALSETTPMRFFLAGVRVKAPAPEKTVVAVGDSITDGGIYAADTIDRNARWPDFLQRRLIAAGSGFSVANAGVSANQVTHDSGGAFFAGGPSLEHRFGRDVLAQPRLRGIVLLEGINDIGLSSTPADQLIGGYRRIAERAHAAGVPIMIGTLTPMSGAFYDSASAQGTRRAVNDWIRTQRVFDGTIDFARAVEDPADPTRMLPRYDSGDHLHPSAAGLEAMAKAIPLSKMRTAFAGESDD